MSDVIRPTARTTEFREMPQYPSPVYGPHKELLGEPYDRDRHVEMWSDAYFEPLQAPSARGGFETSDEYRNGEGLRTCKECGAVVLCWTDDDEESLNRHRRWHDEMKRT